MTLTDKERATLAEEAEWREQREAARPAAGANGIGINALIGMGWEVWSKTRGWAGVDDDGNQIEPIGGIVVAVADRPDRETGEVRQTFTCLDRTRPPHQRVSHLDADDIDRATVSLPNATFQRAAIRRLAQELAEDRRVINFDAEGRCGLINVLRGLLNAGR